MANFAELSILDVFVGQDIKDEIIPGVEYAASGAASFAYMESAIAATLAG